MFFLEGVLTSKMQVTWFGSKPRCTYICCVMNMHKILIECFCSNGPFGLYIYQYVKILTVSLHIAMNDLDHILVQNRYQMRLPCHIKGSKTPVTKKGL